MTCRERPVFIFDVQNEMSRRPQGPRYYQQRRGYYTHRDGKQILLAKGDKDDPDVLANAWERFREVIPAKASKVVAITEEENELLFKHAGAPLSRVFYVLYWIGCRPADVCTLVAEDLDREAKAVRIGRRMVGCDKDFFTWLSRLAEVVPTGPLLRNRRGRTLTVDALHGAFTRLRDRLGLRHELTTFSWRHAFALRFLKEGGTFDHLAVILGISEKQARKLYER